MTEFRDVFGIAPSNMIGVPIRRPSSKKATETFKPILEQSLKTWRWDREW